MTSILRKNIGPTRRSDETIATFVKRLSIYFAGVAALLMVATVGCVAIWSEAIVEPDTNPISNFMIMLMLMIFGILSMGAVVCFIASLFLSARNANRGR